MSGCVTGARHAGDVTVAEPPRTPTGFLLHGTCEVAAYGEPVPYDAAPAPRTPTEPLQLPDGMPARDLLTAVGAARTAGGAALRLVGHGSSGVAVLSLALHQRRLGLQVDEVVCVAADGQDDPVSGGPLGAPGPPPRPTRVRLVPGTSSVSRSWTDDAAAAWRAAGWDVEVGAAQEPSR